MRSSHRELLEIHATPKTKEDTMKTKIKKFLTDESGQDMVEYSLMIVLIGTVVMIYLTGVGLNLNSLLQKVSTRLELISSKIL